MNSLQPSRETVLIVDDQEQNLQIVGTVLTMTGYEVIPASSGEQALKRLAARVPDLILLDVLMPEQDGIETCRKIKADDRLADIPVIFLSAADDKNLIVEALECGGVDYVTKPFNKAELITRVRTHLALKQARDRLRELAEDKDELLGILTHDLANHLAGIQMCARILEDEVRDSASCTKLAVTIAQSTDRMLRFVKEFLANQSAERLQLTPAPMDLSGAIADAAVRHAPHAAAKTIKLEVIPAEGSLHALADPEALAMVLDNLVSNAIKFSPEGSTVTIGGASAAPDGQCVSVRDQGPGFTADDREKMFRRYGRLSARPTADEPSTGLGLSIVRRLVTGMNGRISLEAGTDGGSCFTVRLPAALDA